MALNSSGDVAVHAASASARAAGLSAKVVTRHYLASDHLWTAIQSEAQCCDLERALSGPGGPSTHPTHRSYALSTVFSAVAFLEALVNEVFQDAAEESASRIESLSKQCRALMAEYWGASERANLLTKFQMALLFAGQPAMDRGRAPMQDAILLVAFRNALVHFRPTWHEGEEPDGLERRLAGKFARSSLLGSNDGSPWPIWAVAAPAATWAVFTARALVDEWSDRIHLPRIYETDLEAFGTQMAAHRS